MSLWAASSHFKLEVSFPGALCDVPPSCGFAPVAAGPGLKGKGSPMKVPGSMISALQCQGMGSQRAEDGTGIVPVKIGRIFPIFHLPKATTCLHANMTFWGWHLPGLWPAWYYRSTSRDEVPFRSHLTDFSAWSHCFCFWSLLWHAVQVRVMGAQQAVAVLPCPSALQLSLLLKLGQTNLTRNTV